MKGIKKLVALALGAAMSATVFTGCSTDGLALYKAFNKSQNILSAETKTDIAINISAENMSLQEQQIMNTVIPIVNSSKLSVSTKSQQNEDKTSAKAYVGINANIANMPINTAVWVDTNLTEKNPYVKEIVKIPEILASQLPKEFAGKQYITIDPNKIADIPGAAQPDYNKIIEFSKELQPKLADFIDKYAAQYNPNLNIVSKVGEQYLEAPYYFQKADVYEVKLDDRTFKDLIRYTVNNFAQNKDAINFIKDYMLSSIAISGIPEEQSAEAKAEIEKAFAEFETQLPQTVEQINAGLDKLDAVRLLGDRGITIRYMIDKNGYIVSEKGTVEFVVDLGAINKLSGVNAGAEAPTGIYTVSIDYSSKTTNINGNVNIQMPELNEANSIDYMDLLNSALSTETSTVIAEPVR